MYLQQTQPQAYRMKYFTSDDRDANETDYDKFQSYPGKKETVSYPEQNDDTFSKIRKRLNTLSLNVGYKRGIDITKPLPVTQCHERNQIQPKRISSISSRGTAERYENFRHFNRPRNTSETSYAHDDDLFQNYKVWKKTGYVNRASETAALNKLQNNILTPQQNPELFARQIKLNDKPETERCSSPKSNRSSESTGRIYLGLIETLDLNESLDDLEKIKERYSNDKFMFSLAQYKLRGHDRCFTDSGISRHITRGTSLPSPEYRQPSQLTYNSSTRLYAPSQYPSSELCYGGQTEWEQEKSHPQGLIRAAQRAGHMPNDSTNAFTRGKRRKSVGFDMNLPEFKDSNSTNTYTVPPPSPAKEPRSILKRSPSFESASSKDTNKLQLDSNDSFMVEARSGNWYAKLPKIHSPALRPPTNQFSRKMYHHGDGISGEFERIVKKYGDCRQPSMVSDTSFCKEV